MKKQLIIIALATSMLGGCASIFDVKSSSFGCSGMPEGVKCLSVKDVYSATEASDFVNGEVAEKWREKNAKKAPGAASNGEAVAAQAPAGDTVPAADKPKPIRHPAQVLRVWINAFEDDDGDLYAGQYVFTEIEPRRWSIGNDRGNEKGGLNPLATGGRNTVRETESPLSPVKK